MATEARHWCKHCKRTDFSSLRGLNYHLNHGKCKAAHNKDILSSPSRGASPPEEDPEVQNEGPEVYFPPEPPQKEAGPSFLEDEDLRHDDLDEIRALIGEEFDSDWEDDDVSDADDENAWVMCAPWQEDEYEESIASDLLSSHSDLSLPEVINMGAEDDLEEGPITHIRDQFIEYAEHKAKNHVPLDAAERRSIRLMAALRKKKVALNGYQEIMEWHLKDSGLLREHESVKTSPHYVGREVMINRLKARYNFANKFPFERKVKLPTSGAVVKLTCHDAGSVIQQLLTDPRLQDSNYVFHDDNPRAPPPENHTHLKDFITGSAYRDTHKLLIDPEEGEQLLGLPLYIDGAHISNFHDLEIIQVKIGLGLMNRETRVMEWAWGNLGSIEKVHEQGGRARKILKESNHMEVQDASDSEDHSSEAASIFGMGEENVEDLHAMIGVILETLDPIQARGFLWDLAYQGIIHRDMHYKIFIPYVKCDNVEADKLCGKYQMRGGNVKHVCRSCNIPMQEANDHLHKVKHKTQRQIQKLVKRGDMEGLKSISQTYLINAFHKVRFNMGSDRGIHGACPTDMLHSLQLGIFQYLRDIFFTDLGKTSSISKDINGLAKVFCRLLSRQSDRSIPKCSFSRGIQAGRLMGREYRGVLLIMLCILRSTAGRSIMGQSKKKMFDDDIKVDDWILLVETLLQWEAYLCSHELLVRDVRRLEKKHRYIMYLMRRIAHRSTGMGLKIMKFHIICHLFEDMLLFGVPLEFDTSANESHHKVSKQGAKLTQKAAKTFNIQTATRMTEFRLIELALLELEQGKVPWDYFAGCTEEGDTAAVVENTRDEESMDDSTSSDGSSRCKGAQTNHEEKAEMMDEEALLEVHTGDSQLKVFLGEDGSKKFDIFTRSKFKDQTRMNEELVEFLYELQVLVADSLVGDYLPIFTYHRRGDQIFRAHPNYRGKGSWRDWAWVDFGRHGRVPCHLWCFVVLEGLPKARNAPVFGDLKLNVDGVYAVVECSEVEASKEEVGRSTILLPIRKTVDLDDDGMVTKRHFFLADVNAFIEPCSVVADIGGPPNRYFVVKSREKWSEDFLMWVRDSHDLDVMEELDEDDVVVEEEESE